MPIKAVKTTALKFNFNFAWFQDNNLILRPLHKTDKVCLFHFFVFPRHKTGTYYISLVF